MNINSAVTSLTLEELLAQGKITENTYEKVIVSKKIIEKKYNAQKLKSFEWNIILEKINALDMPKEQKDQIKKEIYKREHSRLRKIRNKQTIYDYEPIKIIGRGAFGEVFICRHKKTKEIVAIKKIKKALISQTNQIKHIKDEQEFMSKVHSPWVIKLKYSFQEGDYLYLVMDYCPGGDLMNLLIIKDILKEEEAQFYIAEIILAIEELHQLDCIHRDIKPDNILIDAQGHIKLSDFGLAKLPDNFFDITKQIDEKKPARRTYSSVGTALYAAPELMQNGMYDKSIDWWSVGVMLYEMFVGYAPFLANNNAEVAKKILNHQQFLLIPSKIHLSPNSIDLIKRLVTDSDYRLGKKGVNEIMSHPFFEGINWSKIREKTPPFVPKLKGDDDTSYFDTFGEVEPFYPPISSRKKRKDGEFIGYTYKVDNNEQINLMKVLELIEEIKAKTANENKAKPKSQLTIKIDTDEHDNQYLKSNGNMMVSYLRSDNDKENEESKIQVITLPNTLKHKQNLSPTHYSKQTETDNEANNKKSRNYCLAAINSISQSLSSKFKSFQSKKSNNNGK